MSIRKKLFVIMFFILMLFLILTTRMILVGREAHVQIHKAETILEELFAVLDTRATMVAHTTRALDCLVLGTEQGKKAFAESADPVIKAHRRWINSIEWRIEFGKDERYEKRLATKVKRQYDDITKLIKDSFELFERGDKQTSYTILEDTVEEWINNGLAQEVNDAETIGKGDLNRSFDMILLQMGAVPWATKRTARQIRNTRDALDYYLGANRLLFDFSMQFREVMDYLVSADEKELGEFEEHDLDAKTSLQLMRKALQVQDAAGWVNQGAESQRISYLEKNHQIFRILAAKAIVIKKEQEPENLTAYVEERLLPFVNTVLFDSVQQEIVWAHDNIEHAMATLLTFTTSSSIEGILLIGSVLIVFSFFIVNLVRGIAVPLSHLTASTEMISKGYLGHRIDLRTNDELGLLARSFDSMTESLQKSQESIVTAKEHTDNILRTMYDTLMVVSPSGKIKTVNEAFYRLLGYEEQDIIGQKVDKVLQGGMRFENQVNQHVESGISKTYLAKDGRNIPVSFSSSPMRDTKSGALGDIVCVAQDMTHRVKERQAKARLERRLLVSEKLAAMSQLAAGLAHELRNPLASIDVNVKNLEDECSENKLTGRCGYSKYVAMIAFEVNKLNRFLEKFVYSMVPHETELQQVICILDKIISSAVNRVRIPLEMKKGKVKLVGHSDQLPVECDQERLIEAFTNIIQNAVDAMPEASTIDITRTKNEYWCEVRICDTGTGLSQEEVEQVFDFRFSTKENGMGVGLPLAQLIIEQHEGNIIIESELDKGTCVIVNLPVADNMTRKQGG